MSWPWTLQRLQQLQLVFISVVFHSVLLPAAKQREQREQREQRQRFRQKRKATLVASRFSDVIHARGSAGTHTGPRKR